MNVDRRSLAFLLFLLPLQHLNFSEATKGCVERVYTGGVLRRAACVCNSTHCDDIEPLGEIGNDEAVFYWSDVGGRRMDRETVKFSSKPADGDDVLVVEVDGDELFQEIIGFGGAFTDSSGIVANSLSESTRTRLMQQYFGKEGAAYTLGRVPIASTDFGYGEYSYLDTPNDFNLTSFEIAKEDFDYKIPLIRTAQSMVASYNSSLRLVASPWSAPAWMKSNGRMVGGGKLRGFAGGPYYDTYAKYLVRFIEEYTSLGIAITWLSMQNEPTTGANPKYGWQTMYFSAQSERDFLKGQLGPALWKSPVAKNTQIVILDDNRFMLPIWADVIFRDPDAAKYASGIAVHWYEDAIYPASVLSTTHDHWPDKFLLATEACNGYLVIDKGVYLGDFVRAEAYANSIIEDLNNFVGGWIDWNLALNADGGPTFVKNNVDAPVIVDGVKDEFVKQPMFYALTHFSRFLRPGTHRAGVQITGDKPDFVAVLGALIEDGRRAAFLLNRLGDRTMKISLRDRARPGVFLNFDLTPHSIVTVVWNSP